VDLAAAVAAIEDVVAGIAGKVIAEMRAEQVGNIRERIASRAAGILRYGNVEADGHAGSCVLIARRVVAANLTDDLIVAGPAFDHAVTVAGEGVVIRGAAQDFEIRQRIRAFTAGRRSGQ